jgi:hypothetical protein
VVVKRIRDARVVRRVEVPVGVVKKVSRLNAEERNLEGEKVQRGGIGPTPGNGIFDVNELVPKHERETLPWTGPYNILCGAWLG